LTPVGGGPGDLPHIPFHIAKTRNGIPTRHHGSRIGKLSGRWIMGEFQNRPDASYHRANPKPGVLFEWNLGVANLPVLARYDGNGLTVLDFDPRVGQFARSRIALQFYNLRAVIRTRTSGIVVNSDGHPHPLAVRRRHEFIVKLQLDAG